MINDQAHWQNLSPPLSPNKHEVDVYRDLIIGYDNVYLLGMTKELQPYCDLVIDANPLPELGMLAIKCDWNNLPVAEDYPEWGQLALLGDGVINLMGMDFVPKVLKSCDLFITRIFHKHFPGMKYAQHFPSKFAVQNSFKNKPKAVIKTQEDISIVVWSAR